MKKEQILDDLEKLQDKIDGMGFKGQNEYDLHLREEIANYILEKVKPKPILTIERITEIMNKIRLDFKEEVKQDKEFMDAFEKSFGKEKKEKFLNSITAEQAVQTIYNEANN